MKVYFIQLTLTKSCNQKCYYCDVYEKEREVEVNLSFLHHILNCLPDNTLVELSGGEPGLVKNLDEVFQACYDHPNVKAIQLMSNGLVRKIGYDWIDKVKYNEHLIYEIDENKIMKFYNLPIVEKSNMHYVIVTTQKTTKSLIKNWNDFEFDRDMFWIKLMNPKTHDFSEYTDDLIKLFELKKDNNSIDMIKFFKGETSLEFQRSLCFRQSPQPAIDLESKEIVHCATTLMKSQREPFTKENMELNYRCKLFNDIQHCKKCYTFDMSAQKMEDIMNSIKGLPVNRRIDEKMYFGL